MGNGEEFLIFPIPVCFQRLELSMDRKDQTETKWNKNREKENFQNTISKDKRKTSDGHMLRTE